jgi:hypothetical protein
MALIMEQPQASAKPLLSSSEGRNDTERKGIKSPTPKSAHTASSIKRSDIRQIAAISTRRLRFWKHAWTTEAIACIFASLSPVGLVTVLLQHHNRPLLEWPQLVTINSIVPLFALLIRASFWLILAESTY